MVIPVDDFCCCCSLGFFFFIKSMFCFGGMFWLHHKNRHLMVLENVNVVIVCTCMSHSLMVQISHCFLFFSVVFFFFSVLTSFNLFFLSSEAFVSDNSLSNSSICFFLCKIKQLGMFTVNRWSWKLFSVLCLRWIDIFARAQVFAAFLIRIYSYRKEPCPMENNAFLSPIYAKWTLLSELFGLVHFQFKGVWLVFIIAMFYRNACN